MTQTPQDQEQTAHLLEYAGVSFLLLLATLATAKAMMDPDNFLQLVEVLLRVALLGEFGAIFVIGTYVLADRILPGSLLDAMYKGNIAIAMFSGLLVIAAVICLFIR